MLDPTTPAPSPPRVTGDASYAQFSFEQLVQRTAGHSLIYTAGTFIQKLAGMLLIPLYWRHLDPDDYGILAVVSILGTFFPALLGLSLPSAITRFYYEWPAHERRGRLGTVWILNWLSVLAIGVPVTIWSGTLIEAFIKQVPYNPYLRLGMWAMIFSSLSAAPLITLRIAERPWLYVFSNITSFVLQTSFSIWFVVKHDLGALGILRAQAITSGLMALAYLVIMLSLARISFKVAWLGETLRYSLPLVPGGLVEAVTSAADRFLLEKYVSLGQLGLYSVADSVAYVVRMFNQALKTAWYPFQMRTASERKADAPRVIGRMATFFTAAIFLVAVAVAVCIRDVVFIINVDKYKPVVDLVPLLIAAYVILGMGTLIGGGLVISGRTEYAWISSLTNLAVLVTVNLVFTPRLGLYGAIVASGLGFFISRVMVSYPLSQRFYPIPFEWRNIIWAGLGALVVFGIGRLIPVPPSVVGLIARGLLVSAYAGVLIYWMLGGRTYLARRLNWRNVRT
jgi:O-antigen/teichoic acid export membrane protein